MRYLGIAGALLAFAFNAASADPVYTQIDVPHARFTRVTGINAAGYVAGYYRTGNGDPCNGGCGYVRSPKGKLKTFRLPHARSMWVNGITNSGTLFGDYYHAGLRHYILTQDGTMTTFQVPGSSTIVALNDQGTAMGYTTRGTRGFVRTPDGTLTLFRIKGCKYVSPTSINAAGVVVGTCTPPSVQSFIPFTRTPDGTITEFSLPVPNKGANTRYIDDDGSIAGVYTDTSNAQHCYILDANGTFHTFDVIDEPSSGYDIASIVRVGDDRQVIGSIYESNRRWYGFVHHEAGTNETFDISTDMMQDFGTFALGASTAGVVAGWYTDGDVKSHGYVRTP